MDLVIAPIHDWKKCEREGFRTRDAHIILEIAKNTGVGKLLILNRPVTIYEMIVKRQWWKVKTGKVILKRSNMAVTQVADNIYVYDFFSSDLISPLFLMKKWYCSVFKKQEVMDTIRESIKILNMRNYTLLFFNPLYVDLMGNIDEKSCVFDSIENWLKHPQLAYAKKYIEMAYDRIRNRADYITTVSKAMKDYFGKDRERVYHISNGVDIDSFETECNHVKPKDLQLIPGPIIGYAGKIQSRIDVELVRYLTNTISGCSFVFIGQEIDPATAKMIRSCKNTYYLGDKHYSQLPAYLKYFDVCIIPHKVTELTASMDPLKLYEYIAAGKPVVTSMVGGVERFSDVVSVAKSKEEFAAGIMKSLENEDEQKRRKCIQILRDEFSWKRKTEEIIKIISTVMDKRK